ncbi:hypothetical protein WICMUC_001652 [Wickerhamomyces mucosus]|uniref:Uncharacterized protein n=1 Tax=Wickerhamomyces mucosus TaxID=1378264 RepID=A0A9P8PTP4_9ASCO|nr:hypothetical protein WICMUC_001652 [Wickerhamomyces mucosus]
MLYLIKLPVLLLVWFGLSSILFELFNPLISIKYIAMFFILFAGIITFFKTLFNNEKRKLKVGELKKFELNILTRKLEKNENIVPNNEVSPIEVMFYPLYKNHKISDLDGEDIIELVDSSIIQEAEFPKFICRNDWMAEMVLSINPFLNLFKHQAYFSTPIEKFNFGFLNPNEYSTINNSSFISNNFEYCFLARSIGFEKDFSNILSIIVKVTDAKDQKHSVLKILHIIQLNNLNAKQFNVIINYFNAGFNYMSSITKVLGILPDLSNINNFPYLLMVNINICCCHTTIMEKSKKELELIKMTLENIDCYIKFLKSSKMIIGDFLKSSEKKKYLQREIAQTYNMRRYFDYALNDFNLEMIVLKSKLKQVISKTKNQCFYEMG